MPEIFHDAEFWVLIAFLIAVAFLVYKAKDKVIAGLDQRSSRIKSELDEARRLADESQESLARFHLAAALDRRQRQALERVALEETRATDEIRHAVIEVALAALRRMLAQDLDAKHRAALIDDAIEALPPTLH